MNTGNQSIAHKVAAICCTIVFSTVCLMSAVGPAAALDRTHVSAHAPL